MAGEFVSIPITTSAIDLADDAIDRLRSAWPGWEPNDGDLEVIQIESLAVMAQNAAEIAASMPAAALRSLGEYLHDIPPQDGSPAEIITTWTLSNGEETRVVPAGTQVNFGEFPFITSFDAIFDVDQTVLEGVVLYSLDHTEDANGLAGLGDLLLQVEWVDQVVAEGPSTGGSDPETDEEYEDRLTRDLRLQATTLVTLRDFEIMAMDKEYTARAVAFNTGPRDVTVAAVGPDGQPLSASNKTDLEQRLEDPYYRMVNIVVHVVDPTYTTINVTWAAVAYPGYAPADVVTRVNAALADFFDPANWGRPITSEGIPPTTEWVNTPVIRRNKVIGIIEQVDGVDYVTTLSINGNTTGDVTMAGTVALPNVGTMAGTVTVP